MPLSSTAPDPVEPWHYPLPPGVYPPARAPMWAKCDMVATVALFRLDRVKTKVAGRREYQVFHLAPEHIVGLDRRQDGRNAAASTSPN